MYPTTLPYYLNDNGRVNISLDELNNYFLEINNACVGVSQYLQKNEKIEDLPASISELIHAVFNKLKFEIRDCIEQERREMFPLVRGVAFQSTEAIENAVEKFKESHFLILKIVQKLRQLLFNYKVKPTWSTEFRDCIVDLYRLENNIYKWISIVEEKLFPQLLPQQGKVKYMRAAV